jgi:uncharacterized membrane protein YphA (DoxX/SURF4 family)
MENAHIKEKIDFLKPYILLTIRTVVGVLFFYSGLTKAVRPPEFFIVAINQFQIIPEGLVYLAALVVPWVEILTAAYLILGYRKPWSMGGLIGLTLAFQLVLAQALIRQLPVDECGCFGGATIHLTLYQSFLLDTLIIVLLIILVSSHNDRFSLDRYLGNKKFNSHAST